ncbi:MAG: GNAT family N-acetyltransferase [Acidobacteria bacterium]|nr:GNAT family N-acetyltransferase [Acidobacteriota bacterium]
MKPPEQIETERLVLRIPSLADTGAIFNSYAQDTEVLRYLTWRPHQNIQETEGFLVGCIIAWDGDARFPYVITLRESGEVIGMIEIRINVYKADAGYVLSRQHWGKGIATEALCSLVEWALRQASIYRVWALCDVDNLASAGVLEKVGMEREGLLRRQIVHPNISDEPRDCYCYAAVK